MSRIDACSRRVGLVIGALAAVPLAAACSSSRPGVAAAGGHGGGSAAVVDAAADVVSGSFGADADPFAMPGADARTKLPDDLRAASMPVVHCPNGDVRECELPPSSCAWPRDCEADLSTCMSWSTWIVYYEHPTCFEGTCLFDQSYFLCDSASTCRLGACVSTASTS